MFKTSTSVLELTSEQSSLNLNDVLWICLSLPFERKFLNNVSQLFPLEI